MAYGQHTFQWKPRWEDKKEGEIMDLSLCGMTMGKRIKGVYENGLKHGLTIAWHKNGVKWQQNLITLIRRNMEIMG